MNLEAALATVLKKKRKAAGISQEALAYHCNIDRTYVSLIERQKRRPTVRIIFAMCEILHVKPSDFFKEVEGLMER